VSLVVAGAGFGGGANGWAFVVAGFGSVLLAAAVVAAGRSLACWSGDGRDTRRCVDGLDRATYAVPLGKSRALRVQLQQGG
jgi:hypothetical protein